MNVFNIIYLDMKYKIILNVNLKRTVYRSLDCELKKNQMVWITSKTFPSAYMYNASLS